MGRRERRCKAIKPEGREGHIHIAPSFGGSKKVREAIFGAKQEKEKMEAEGCVCSSNPDKWSFPSLSLSLKRTHTLAFPPSQLETERAETSEIKTAAHSLALYSNGVSMAGENMGIEQQEKRGHVRDRGVPDTNGQCRNIPMSPQRHIVNRDIELRDLYYDRVRGKSNQ